ncbi:MAG: hypothetical protein R2794_08915 [Chitinophagales bacterium]
MRNALRYLLVFLCLLELLSITWLRKWAGPFNSPVYLLVCGIAIGVVYYFLEKEKIEKEISGAWKPKWMLWTSAGCMITLSALLLYHVLLLIQQYPIDRYDSSVSDIIPQTEVMVHRLRAGVFPYSEIHMTNYSMFPGYMPLQWMPYVLADVLGMDYRLFATLFLLGAMWLYFMRTTHAGNVFGWWPALVWYLMLQYDAMPFAYTLETMIAAFYFLTIWAIGAKNIFAATLGMGVCLLSRYSIILWVPLFFIILLLNREPKKMVWSAGILAGMYLCIYILPFLSRDIHIYSEGYNYYTKATVAEWERTVGSQKPEHIFNGLGTASWGYAYFTGNDMAEKVHKWQQVHFWVSLITVIILAGSFYIKRKTLLPGPWMRMSLKVYLSVFYIFIQIPFDYLFFVPLMCSALLLVEAQHTISGRRVSA